MLKRIVVSVLLVFSPHLYAQDSCDNKITRENVLTKIGYAPTTESMNNISNFCHYQDWIKSQLENVRFYDDSNIEKKFEDFETTKLNSLDLVRKYNSEEVVDETNLMKEAFSKRFNYAIYSENRLREMMVWFWFNHFNVFGDSGAFRYMSSYESIFRENAFGNFKDILWEVSHHPNMLMYIDNDYNDNPTSLNNRNVGLNENYAREFLELHTLGVDGGYSEKDVQELAKILTGFKSIQAYPYYINDLNPYLKEFSQLKNEKYLMEYFKKHPEFKISKVYHNYGLYFDFAHVRGDKYFLGHTIKDNGDKELNEVINIVTENPNTAYFLSKKLALYFLGEDGEKSLIESMVNEFQKNHGEIKSVLKLLLNSEQFKSNLTQRKTFKNPYEYYISTTKLTFDGKPIVNSDSVMYALNGLSFGTYWKLTPEGYSLYGHTYLSPNTLHQYINFSQYIQSNECFQQEVDIERNYYRMQKDEYLKFIISQQWLNK